MQEKDIVLAISKRLGVILNSYGISVKYSRETDTFIDLDPRAQQANNWGANLFVSIHANSATASASGTECYTKPAADSKTKQLSANVAKSISSKLGIPNRGHKEEVWRVLMSSNMPAILVETAFITNSGDANLLKNKLDDFANALANQILNYLNINSDDIVQKVNNTGFANSLGVNFSATGQTLVLFTSGAITIKLRNSLSATNDGAVVANFSNGSITSGTLKTDLVNLIQNLDNSGYGASAKLAEINNISFSVAVMSNTNNTTITFTTSTPIPPYGAANQSIIIEINRPALQTAYVTNTLPSLAKSIKNVNPFLTALMYLALIVTAVVIIGTVILLIASSPLGAAILKFLGALVAGAVS